MPCNMWVEIEKISGRPGPGLSLLQSKDHRRLDSWNVCLASL